MMIWECDIRFEILRYNDNGDCTCLYQSLHIFINQFIYVIRIKITISTNQKLLTKSSLYEIFPGQRSDTDLFLSLDQKFLT